MGRASVIARVIIAIASTATKVKNVSQREVVSHRIYHKNTVKRLTIDDKAPIDK